MPKKNNLVYRFRITLLEIEPFIWRLIDVPKEYDFWAFHVAIQDAMGWQDYHLHDFQIGTSKKEALHIGIPDPEDPLFKNELLGRDENIDVYFSMPGESAKYLYDFGDAWEHNVTLEGILLRDDEFKYPRCVDGARACPPEDCGGVWGYSRLLEFLANPESEENEFNGWDSFDPEVFDPTGVRFDDPDERWSNYFEN